MSKRLLTALLLVPLMALADVETVDGIEWRYTVSGGQAQIEDDDHYPGGAPAISAATTGDIIVPSILGGCPVTSIGNYAFNGCGKLVFVTIPSSVTRIGNYAFQNCGGLVSNAIPSSVTSIGNSAFQKCSGLKSVSIPSSVTSIGSSAFYGCSGLASITIPLGVKSIGSSAFKDCSGLKSVEIPSSVTSVGDRVFDSCDAIREAVVPGWNCTIDFESVTNLVVSDGTTAINERAFAGCSNLTSVTLPVSVKSIGVGSFQDCVGLTTMEIPTSVTGIGASAFSGCSGFLSMEIPSSVTSIGEKAFSGCSGLAEMVIPSSVRSVGNSAFEGCSGLLSLQIINGARSIGSAAFAGCTNLTSATIPTSVTSIGPAVFADCDNLLEITVAEGNSAYRSKNGMLYDKAMSELVQCTAGRKGVITIPTSVTRIANSAFSGCSKLESVTIPPSVKSIGSFAFRGCSGFDAVTVPKGVATIGEGAFEGCTGLTALVIPTSVTSIGARAFADCANLTSVTIPSSVTSIGEKAFDGCMAIVKAVVPGWKCTIDFASVTNLSIAGGTQEIMTNAFEGCSGLTSVTIPSSVTSIGEGAFDGCTAIGEVAVPGWKCRIDFTSVSNLVIAEGTEVIKGSAFADCSALRRVTIPASVTNIGEHAFGGCDGLRSFVVSPDNLAYSSKSGVLYDKAMTDLILCPGGLEGSVTIPASVTNIGERAFANCRQLTEIKVADGNSTYCSLDGILYDTTMSMLIQCPAGRTNDVSIAVGVARVGAGAFGGCRGLGSVKIPASVSDIGKNAFDDTKLLNEHADGLVIVDNCLIRYKGTCGETVAITNGVRLIAGSAFSGCNGLAEVSISTNVTSIGEGAFEGCDNLKKVSVDSADEVDRVRNMLKKSGFEVGGVEFVYPGQKKKLSPAAIAGITVGVAVAGHIVGCVVSEAIGKKKGHPTYKQFRAMTLSVSELDEMGITYKNRLIYHPAKGTVTGRIVLKVRKNDRTRTVCAKAKGALQDDGTFVGTLDAKGLGTFEFTLE